MKTISEKSVLRYTTNLRKFFDRWTRQVSAQDSEILEGITGESFYLQNMRPKDTRQILRAGRKPDNREREKLDNMKDRLFELAKLKEKIPKQGLKTWIDGLDKKREANMKMIQDRLAIKRLIDLLRENLRRVW